MTTDLFDDLGDRLDRLAADQVADIDLPHPSEHRASPARQRTALLAAAAAVLIVIVAVWGIEQRRPDTSPADEIPMPTDTLPPVGPLRLAPWAALPIIDVDELSGGVRSRVEGVADPTTLRRLEGERPFLIGLSVDHTEVVAGWDDENSSWYFVGVASVELLNGNFQVSLVDLNGDGYSAAVPPGWAIGVELESGRQLPIGGAMFEITETDSVTSYLDAEGATHEIPELPFVGDAGASADIDLVLRPRAGTGAAFADTTITDVVCLRLDDSWQVMGRRVTAEATDSFVFANGSLQIDATRPGGSGSLTSFGTANSSELSVTSDGATLRITVDGEQLNGTMTITCPNDAPHLDDLVAAMRGG